MIDGKNKFSFTILSSTLQAKCISKLEKACFNPIVIYVFIILINIQSNRYFFESLLKI